MTEQQIFRATATPEDFKNANLGDWVEGVGEITTQYELDFIHRFGYSYTNEREKVHTKQCVNCIRRGLRECMYHGYPEETIPLSCAYKIGDAAVNTVYDVPVATRKRGEQK